MTAQNPDQPCRVVIIGMMGSGKTTIGKLLSEATGWPRYDNDQLLDQLYGMTPKQILEARGEQDMRDAEDAALVHGLNGAPPCIVEAAAGTILSETSRAALKDAIVVWLSASPDVLFHRAAGAAHRPWLDGGAEWVRTAARERESLYAGAANIVVDTDQRAPGAVAGELLTQLRERRSGLASPAP